MSGIFRLQRNRSFYDILKNPNCCIASTSDWRPAALPSAVLTNLEQPAAQVLQPVAREVLNSCLESETLTLDETPGKAGGKSKGKMQTGYFCSFYSDRDEVTFIYSVSRSCDVVEPCLKDREGFSHRCHCLRGLCRTHLAGIVI